MKFEWHPPKAERNLEKHGVSFDEAATVFDHDLQLILQDTWHSIGERRYRCIGRVKHWWFIPNERMSRALSVPEKLPQMRKINMNKKITLLDDDDYDLHDDVEPETDFSRWQVVRRGKQSQAHTVTLAPDVAAVFPISEAVNNALRQLIQEKKAA